jgi:hypothetical protein
MGTKVRPADTDEAAAPTVATTEEIEHAEPAATVPPAVPLSLHDYSCPICLELLLRPVKLSCGHHFCRGCWVRVLQSRDGRAAANTTGSAACPFRCEVRPVVPEVDQALASELESHFDEEYTERASAYALPDEERKAAEVNAWAAAGCVLDTPEDESATLDEVAAALRSTEMTARRVEAQLQRLAQVEEAGSRQRLLKTVNRVLTVASAVLAVLLLALFLCIMVALVVRANYMMGPLLVLLRETFIFCVVLLAGLATLRHCAQRHVQRHIDSHGHAGSGRAAVRRAPRRGGPRQRLPPPAFAQEFV